MPSSEPPHLVVRELFAGVVHVHPWCGRPMGEHAEWAAPESPCEFAPAAPIRFAVAAPEPVVRVCGIPDPSSIPPEVMRLLGDLARACRDAYGLGVEVESPDEREAAQLAVETLRRYLG